MPIVRHARFVLAAALLACIGCDRLTTAGRGQAGAVVRQIVVLCDSLSVTPTQAESFPALLQKRLLEPLVK
jgi:hypothetical protein